MMMRTPTKHKTTDSEWNTQWTVAGVPSSGFRLKCRKNCWYKAIWQLRRWERWQDRNM